MIEFSKLKVGQMLFCSQINECCEGWEATSFHKTEVTSIEQTSSGTTIKFNNGVSTIYLNQKGENIYQAHSFFTDSKEAMLQYISDNVLV